MKDMRFSFKQIVSFQTYSCLALVILVTLISLSGIVKVKPIYDFGNYFGEQNAEDRVTDAVMGSFDIGLTDVITGIPQLVEAIYFDGGELGEFDEYGSSIRDYLDQEELASKQRLTMYVYMTFSAFDESMFVGFLLLLQLCLLIYLPLVSIFCAIYVAARFFTDRERDYFVCYQDVQRGIKPIIQAAMLIPVIAVLLPNITFSWTGMILFAVIILFVLFNAVCVRLKEYTRAQKRYLNVLQIGSLVNIASVGVFWAGLMISGILQKLLKLCAIDTWDLYEALVLFEGELSFAFSEIFIVTLTGLFLCFSLLSRNALSTSINRSFCNTQKKRFGNILYESVFIKRSVFPALGILLLVVFLVDSGDLKFKDEELIGFIITAAGASLILLSEIAVKVMIDLICIDLGKSGADNVLRGDVYDRRDKEI